MDFDVKVPFMLTSLKDKLQKNEPAIGGWIMTGNTTVAEIMARAGYDWVAIDIEHTGITIREVEELIRTITSLGVPALVRLTATHDEFQIKRVMDAGATGIIAPLVRTAEDAQKAVAAMNYPPKGVRGVAIGRAAEYGANEGLKRYQDWLESGAVCIAQIEHIEAVENAEAILNTPGIDGYIMGPYDLSCSMGLTAQFDHPDFIAAMARVKAAGETTGKPGGLHVVEPDEAMLKAKLEEGYRFLAYSIDTRILDTVCRAGVTAAKPYKS